MPRTLILLLTATLAALPESAPAQEPVHWDVVARIREEGLQRSQVMDLAWYMSDVLGPRLTGSPGMRRAERWVRAKMDSLGFSRTAIEPFGPHGVGWSNEYTSLHLLAPSYQPLIGYPQAFTPGTAGKVTGEGRIARIRTASDVEQFRGTLRGAIVLSTAPVPAPSRFRPDAVRWTPDSLARMAAATIATRYGVDGVAYAWDSVRRTYVPAGGEAAAAPAMSPEAVLAFFKAEGVAAVLEGAAGGDGTVFLVGRAGSRQDRSAAGIAGSPPVISLAAEHYNRLYRLAERGVPTRLELEVRNQVDSSETRGFNIVGELPGTDLADQLVMVGAHFDSWHSATGATDNAAGSAVALEALRILQAIGVKPRRTIRVALWSYEEGGVVGSRRYVATHFGDPARKTPLYDKFSVYLNMDNGTGQFRGVYLQGNERVRPIFTEWMKPFADLGMNTLTINNAFGTDIIGFDMAGLPAFQFIQDPIAYETRTHHSNMDLYDKLVPEDLRRNAVILASFLYHAAMRNELLPRESHRQ
jgi:carboxypeptidase Q